MRKGGSGGEPAKAPVQVKYKKEEARDEMAGGGRRSIGARYMQTRRATPAGGGGFGGQKPTLG